MLSMRLQLLPPPPGLMRVAGAPNLWLAGTIAILCALLMLPLTIPIGPFYWDTFIYFDAAHRIFDGQVPVVDFFAPVGPLGYWLFAGLLRLFPSAQPLYLVQWSLLVVTAPLMALLLHNLGPASRGIAFALLVPFLVFSLLPFNVEQFYPYPGTDGYGIYNRQASNLLYVLTAALVFARGRRTLLVSVALALTALFLVKVTGFLAALPLCALAVLAGCVPLQTAALIGLAVAAALAALEISFGLVGDYVGHIATLVQMNQGGLVSSLFRASATHFGVVAAAGALALVLLVLDRTALPTCARALLRRPSMGNLAALLDRSAIWLGVATLCGIAFESQNLGGQAFIFIWPILLKILRDAHRLTGRAVVVVLALVAACAMPSFVEILQRAARTYAGQLNYEPLQSTHLGTLGAVSQRPEAIARADMLLDTYARFPETFRHIAATGNLPSYTLYAEPEFQIAWLKAADEAVAAILALEAQTDRRFETILSLNFTNPFPFLLGRKAPHHVAIGADPFRTVPAAAAETLDALRATDLVLYPKCPVTVANEEILTVYREGLREHRRTTLSRCWDAFVRPD